MHFWDKFSATKGPVTEAEALISIKTGICFPA